MYNYNTAGSGGGPLPRLDGSASPTDYPYGKMKNDDPPGSGTGTPCQYESLSDSIQAMYACLVNAGVAPNELPENVNNSDFLRALRNMFFSVGDLKFHYGDTSPSTNWLICDGTTFSAVTYPELNVFLGGTTLPNFKGRAIVDLNGADSDFDTIGEEGGAKVHQLTVAEMPEHLHSMTTNDQDDGSQIRQGGGGSSGAQNTGLMGDDEAHNNLQPYKVALVLIKAK